MKFFIHAANPGNTAALPGDIQELERRIEKLEAKIVQLTAGVPQAVLKPGTVVGKIAKDSRITDLPGDSSAQTVPTVSRGGEYSQTMAVSPQAIHVIPGICLLSHT